MLPVHHFELSDSAAEATSQAQDVKRIPTTKAHNLHIPTNLHMGKSWVTYLLMELHGTFFWKFEVFHGTFFALFRLSWNFFLVSWNSWNRRNPPWNFHGTSMELSWNPLQFSWNLHGSQKHEKRTQPFLQNQDLRENGQKEGKVEELVRKFLLF